MSTPRFDLVDIIRIIEKRKRFVIAVTLICIAIGLLFYFLRKKKYEAKAAFFVSNPIYTDRTSIFGGADSRYTDYFGGEDDIDRVIALAGSDTIITQIIKNTGYDKANNLDVTNPYDKNKLKMKFNNYLDIKRTEYKLLELSFTDTDPALAANVANEAVKDIEAGYRNFYNSRKMDVINSLHNRLAYLDSTINSLTDTIGRMRDHAGIYDIMSPSRVNLVSGSIKPTGRDAGLYVELIQNYESNKDILVFDRSKSLSLLNEYHTGMGEGEVTLLHSITVAKPPVDPAGPNVWIILLASTFVGFFFSIFYLLLTSYYRDVVRVND